MYNEKFANIPEFTLIQLETQKQIKSKDDFMHKYKNYLKSVDFEYEDI